jgi:uncharacterized membrane protein YheB (UPF0754 family)
MDFNLITLILLPFITAFIGWLTNWFAIKMLFHPREPKAFPLLGKWQGLVPKRQQQLAGQAAEIIEREIISHHVISTEIRKIDLTPYLEAAATRLIHERLAPKLRQIPLLGGLINDEAVSRMEASAREEILREAEPVMDIIAGDFEQKFNVKELVEERIRAFDVIQLEEIVNEVAKTEFKTIERLGAVLGFLVGLVQLGLLLLTGALTI